MPLWVETKTEQCQKLTRLAGNPAIAKAIQLLEMRAGTCRLQAAAA